MNKLPEKEKILIVEDEVIIGLELQEKIRSFGYNVIGLVATGEEAIEIATKDVPNLVLMDINLRGELDGIQTADEIRSYVDIPVVYLTAYADEKTLERAKITGPFGYIVKPYEDVDLITSISVAIQKHCMDVKVKQSERWLYTTLRSITDAVIATDEKGNVKFINSVAEKLIGIPQRDVIGREVSNFLSILNENKKNEIENPAIQVLKHGFLIDKIENAYLRNGQGAEIPVIFTASPIKDDLGFTQGVVLTFKDITERKKAETEIKKYQEHLEDLIKERTSRLEQSEEMFRALTENSHDMIMRFNSDLEFLYANPIVNDMLGVSHYNLLGKKLDDFNFPSSLVETLKKALGSVFSKGENSRLEFMLPNGAWIDWFLFPEFGINEQVISVITSGMDITEKKLHEQEILVRDRLLHGVAEASYHILSDNDLNAPVQKVLEIMGKAAHVNRAYIVENKLDEDDSGLYMDRIYEWTSAPELKTGLRPELNHAKYHPNFSRWEQELSADNTIEGLTKDFPESERELLNKLNIKSTLLVPINIHKKFWGFIGLDDVESDRAWGENEVSTVTILAEIIGSAIVRRNFQEELKTSKERWKFLFEYAPECYFLYEPDGTLIDGNQEAQNMLGLSKEEFIGIKLFDLGIVPESQTDVVNNIFERNAFGASTGPDELTLVNGNKESITVEIRTYPTLINDRKLILGIAHDVSKRKKIEDTTKEALRKEKELNELKSRFVSMVSHEFRTPLTTILASADLLEMFGREWKEEKYFEHIVKIQNSVEHLTEMLTDVLSVSRAEAGKIKVQFVEVDIVKYSQDIIDEVILSDDRKHVIKFNYTGPKKFIPIDDKLYRNILQNLMSNAIKYSNGGSSVNVELAVTDSDLELTVKDKGIGISASDQSKLFEPFFRGENVSNISGTGLGLTVLKSAVELLDGRIDFKSKLGKGSTFKVSLPLNKHLENIEA